MKEKTWKRLILGMTFVICVFLVSVIKYYDDSSYGQLTGEEYLRAQEKYMAEFEVYAGDMDAVVALYLDDSISEDDFLNHLAIFQDELTLMYSTYQTEKETHPVRTGTHTYHTKKGCEAVEQCYGIFQNILNMMKNNYGDKEALAYKYIAYHQDVIGAVSEYMTAVELETQDSLTANDTED